MLHKRIHTSPELQAPLIRNEGIHDVASSLLSGRKKSYLRKFCQNSTQPRHRWHPVAICDTRKKRVHRQTIDALSAYQVAFDLFGNEYQLFLLSKRDRLPEVRASSSLDVACSGAPAALP